MKSLFSLQGKVAVVTGGSRGIGAMITRGFLENGVKTYITSRKVSELEAAAAEFSEIGECVAIRSDLSTLDGVRSFADAVKDAEDRVDILVNNAGATWGAALDDYPEAGWDKVMDLNVKSLFFLTQKLAPLLRAGASAEQPAKVVNVASIDGIYNANIETYSYSASKAAVIHLTRRMAKRLIEDHINVTAIAPGAFASDMNVWTRDTPDEVAKSIPARRVGTPEDMAGTAVYICSRAGDYLVGITIAVDGGVVYAS